MVQCAESLRCYSCVWDSKPGCRRERVRDLKDMRGNGRAQLVAVRGSSYSPWRKCFESTVFSVTPRVTDVMTALGQLKDHVKSMGGVLSKAGVRCSLSSLSHCVIAQAQVHSVGQLPRRCSREEDPGRTPAHPKRGTAPWGTERESMYAKH